MRKLGEQILEETGRWPNSALISAKALLHLGNRAAIDQALSRLHHRGHLQRAGRGLYVLPVASRFGQRLSLEALLEHVSARTGEVITATGATAANALGLTTQTPVREIRWTSGRSRTLQLGGFKAELRHATRWKLVLPDRLAGEVVRAAAWTKPGMVAHTLTTLWPKLPESEREALLNLSPQLPTWLAQALAMRVSS